MRSRVALFLLVLPLLLPGCGDGSDSSESETVPGGADPEATQVIEDWADELRAGDVKAAAERFELPSVVQNGTPPIELRTRADVVDFNESLPCGAKLTHAESSGGLTIATFELTERPGPGQCGVGTGNTAKTAFRIEDGLIAEWRRVADEEQVLPPAEGPVV